MKTLDDFKDGFWEWVKQNHPEWLREYHNYLSDLLKRAEPEFRKLGSIVDKKTKHSKDKCSCGKLKTKEAKTCYQCYLKGLKKRT